MCQRPHKDEDEDDHVRPQPLQFVHVGKGGAVESLSTVRSHVMKGHHQKSREVKKAYLKRAKQRPRRIELRPTVEEERSAVTDESLTLAAALVPCEANCACPPFFSFLFCFSWEVKRGHG